jgi:hypothetical protein
MAPILGRVDDYLAALETMEPKGMSPAQSRAMEAYYLEQVRRLAETLDESGAALERKADEIIGPAFDSGLPQTIDGLRRTLASLSRPIGDLQALLAAIEGLREPEQAAALPGYWLDQFNRELAQASKGLGKWVNWLGQGLEVATAPESGESVPVG